MGNLLHATSEANRAHIYKDSPFEYSWAINTRTKEATVRETEWIYYNCLYDYKVIKREYPCGSVENAIEFLYAIGRGEKEKFMTENKIKGEIVA